jgi:hypothetical protein
MDSAPQRAEPPEAHLPAGSTRLVQATPGEVAPPGQTSAALARIPQARPALVGHAAGEIDVAGIAAWPEPKPEGLSAIKEAAAPPPQPELKPKGP